MKKTAVIIAAALVVYAGAAAQTGAKRSSSGAKSAAPKAAASKSSPQKSTPAKKSAVSSGAKKPTGTPAAVRRPAKPSRTYSSRWRRPALRRVYAQQQPTPERYREIQKALIDKGYLVGEANGRWGPESVDALRRFQEELNIEPADGKLNSLSLIALGLGPKRTSNLQARPSP